MNDALRTVWKEASKHGQIEVLCRHLTGKTYDNQDTLQPTYPDSWRHHCWDSNQVS